MNEKYDNPINKPTMVKVPKWEYAQLVSKAATLEIMMALVEAGDKYKAMDVLEIVLKAKEDKEEV